MDPETVTDPMTIVHVASECYPFVKTGGLADAVAGLSAALARRGHHVRVLLPAYRGVIPPNARSVAQWSVPGAGQLWPATLWEAEEETGRLRWGFLAIPPLFDRDGGPYLGPDGRDWWDNGERFAVFSRAAAQLVLGQVTGATHWHAKVIHAHDWQTGLVAPFVHDLGGKAGVARPKIVFTIHNAAFHGWFPESLFRALDLPQQWWDFRFLEAWGQLNFLKAGVVLSDWVTTVSPGYAQELLTGIGAHGLEGVLRERASSGRFIGILNGIDEEAWNPAFDPNIARRYDSGRGLVAAKRANRAALLCALGADEEEARRDKPVAGFVGRLTEQKGVDWLMAAIPPLLAQTPLRFAIVGSGDRTLEAGLRELAAAHPRRLFCHFGYAEKLAHQLYAGSDCLVMPSRFEPCGLTQLYAMRYGTPPVARAVGGLQDTVVDETKGQGATGFLYTGEGPEPLATALFRAVEVWRTAPYRWRRLMVQGMERDDSWAARIPAYEAIYRSEQ